MHFNLKSPCTFSSAWCVLDSWWVRGKCPLCLFQDGKEKDEKHDTKTKGKKESVDKGVKKGESGSRSAAQRPGSACSFCWPLTSSCSHIPWLLWALLRFYPVSEQLPFPAHLHPQFHYPLATTFLVHVPNPKSSHAPCPLPLPQPSLSVLALELSCSSARICWSVTHLCVLVRITCHLCVDQGAVSGTLIQVFFTHTKNCLYDMSCTRNRPQTLLSCKDAMW